VPSLPNRTDVLVIGGGVIGCSIAYHLAKRGFREVLLLERRQLTCGTTWHAAGLIPQLRATRNLTELAKYTSELLYALEAETGQATGYRQNGSISIALNPERFEELKRGASMARGFGVDVEVVGPAEIRHRYPLLDLRGVVGGIYLPKDGQANPVDVTQAYAKGARLHGARIVENIEVNRILVENGRAVGVRVSEGEIRAEAVVIAAGMWSHALAREIGVHLPLHAAEHFYVVTESIADLPKGLPTLRVPDECAYYKEDAGKLLVGSFEPVAKPWGMNGIPRDFCFDSLPDDAEHFMPILELAAMRVPVLQRTGIQTWFNGPESFTPDDRYLLGETTEVRDLFVACGFNSVGIQSSGGVGKVVADWIHDRHAPMDLVDVDVRRMQPFQSTRGYLRERTVESLGLLYAMHWPFRQYKSARGARRSPLHERLIAAGAAMGELAGWERPNWFAPVGVEPSYAYSYGKQNWFEHCAAECGAVRDSVALFDQSSFAKFMVKGGDAAHVLNRISANDVDVAPGRVVYTQWLNELGGIEADLTVTRVAQDEFMIVTSAACQTRDWAWLQRHIPSDARCTAFDITSGIAVLGVMGPRSRELLERLTGEDLSNSAFPFGASRNLEIGYAPVRASRITYVGELGWELYVATDFAVHVCDRLREAEEGFGLRLAGFHAMNACRMEKGYRHWGDDIGVEDNPLQAGLGFAVAWDKHGGFIGREALLAARAPGAPTRRLLQFRLPEDSRLLYREEPIFVDGRCVGSVTSGMYGHRVGAPLGMGYVRHDEGVDASYLAGARFEIEIASERIPAQAQLTPFYDPKSARVRS